MQSELKLETNAASNNDHYNNPRIITNPTFRYNCTSRWNFKNNSKLSDKDIVKCSFTSSKESGTLAAVSGTEITLPDTSNNLSGYYNGWSIIFRPDPTGSPNLYVLRLLSNDYDEVDKTVTISSSVSNLSTSSTYELYNNQLD